MIETFRRWSTRRPAALWWAALVVTLALLAGVALRWWQTRPPSPALVAYSSFITALDSHAVADLTVVPGRELRGVWSRQVAGPRAGQPFVVEYPTTEVAPLQTPESRENAMRGGSRPHRLVRVLAHGQQRPRLGPPHLPPGTQGAAEALP